MSSSRSALTLTKKSTELTLREPSRDRAELGVTVSELVAELVTLESEPLAVESEEIGELDRRWKKVEGGGHTVPQEQVVRWLRTWGTPRFQPWPGR